jgi:hypothetical protein
MKEMVNKMPAVPQKPRPICERIALEEKSKWRRDTASKCLVAAYETWQDCSIHDLARAIVKTVDALDRALEDSE